MVACFLPLTYLYFQLVYSKHILFYSKTEKETLVIEKFNLGGGLSCSLPPLHRLCTSLGPHSCPFPPLPFFTHPLDPPPPRPPRPLLLTLPHPLALKGFVLLVLPSWALENGGHVSPTSVDFRKTPLCEHRASAGDRDINREMMLYH